MSEAKKNEAVSPERLELESMDIVSEQKAKLKDLFPEAFTEGGRIDFDTLRKTLGETVDAGKERYGLMWAGKSDCFRTIQRPSTGTLAPVLEQSIEFEETQNIIVEGDNLEALKLLQKSYLGKVKMIYIDPPYNTGNDFIYPDDFSESLETYLRYTGQVDNEGRKFSNNLETDGRFHSRWLSMIYPRLFLARNLLREDGVIFISIDDHEVDNLKKICSEVFGEENFLACICWQKRYAPSNDTIDFSATHDYILAYARQRAVGENGRTEATLGKLERTDEQNRVYRNPDNDPRGNWRPDNYTCNKTSDERPNLYYPIIHPKTREEIYPSKTRVWAYSKDLHLQHVKENRIWWGLSKENKVPSYKRFISDVGGIVADTWWDWRAVGHNDEAKKQLLEIFDNQIGGFDTPKPTRLIERMLQLGTSTKGNDLILDFFAGSGTTAHAVLETNRRDGGNRRFILIQLPEINSDQTATNIADICRERVRRVVKKYKDEAAKGQGSLFDSESTKGDLGFRAFKLQSSTFRKWEQSGDSSSKELMAQLPLQVENVDWKQDQKTILFEILLKSGFTLAASITELSLADKRVFSIEAGALLICLERQISKDVIVKMADLRPVRVVCLDSSFAGNDQLKVNAVETFKAKGITFKTV